MRILCLTSRLPYPPDRGDRLRAFNFIRQLAREHHLTLVSFVASAAEKEHLSALAPYCEAIHVLPLSPARSAATVLLNLWRPLPLQALYYRSRAMDTLLGEITAGQRFDAAYVHLFRMAPYAARLRGLYRIVDLTDVISKEVRRSLPYRRELWRFVYRVEQPRIERYERQVARTFEEVWLIAEAERQSLAAACPEANIRVVPNGVDLELFRPDGGPSLPNSLIFVGHLRVPHNIDAAMLLATRVLPLVQAQVPDCSLAIVGADPAPEVLALAKAPGVTVTGFVPDLNRRLNQASLFAAPLRFAAGVQNKVLEAMAAGRPVVTSSMVAEGLGGRPGEDFLLADDPASMAAQIVALLGDERRRQRIAESGLRLVRECHSWDRVSQRMQVIARELAEREPA